MTLYETDFYIRLNNRSVKCQLCPKQCRIAEHAYGDCLVRKNVQGRLISEVYGKLAAINLDPVEKKPLYHFYPGNKILSVGTNGCNFHCEFCQNHQLSQTLISTTKQSCFTPEKLVETALFTRHNLGIAFTYNEPAVNYEFMLNTAALAKQAGLVSAMISNGYLQSEPLNRLLTVIDAFNIDLKAFDGRFYHRYCKGTLAPVLKTISQIHKAGSHLELTNLLIPGLNDDERVFREMCRWIAGETGKSTVLHLSAYFPAYRVNLPPTPAATLFRLYDVAKSYLHHVYAGNLPAGDRANTFCPGCGTKLIERNFYKATITGLDAEGRCLTCSLHEIKYMNYETIHS